MTDSRQLRRFQNESRAAASLHHPHIVPVFAVGADRGVNFFVMQLIDGQTLSQRIKSIGSSELTRTAMSRPTGDSKREGEAPAEPRTATAPAEPRTADKNGSAGASPSRTSPASLSIEQYREVARQGMQVAQALEHAHSMGIVHRDVKPSNLLIDRAGKLWVTDFGLARIANDLSMTISGDVLGTLRYMSPEQALAKHGLVDHRTDIYSLGVTLYELLTLRPAIDGKDRGEILHKIAFEEPPEPRRVNPHIPLDLETILLRSIAKEPHLRHQSAEELADDLRRFADDQPIKARRQTRWQSFVRWQRRNRALSAALALTVAVIVVANVLITWKWSEERLANSTARIAEQSAKRSERLARDAEQLARHAELQATQRADELQRSVYLQQIARSEQEWWSNNVGRAEQILDRCPPELRHWEWGYLKRLCNSEIRSFVAHDGPMFAVAYSPNGRTVAACGQSGKIHLWDIPTGTERTLLGHSAGVQSVAFSSDGQQMVSTGSSWAEKIPGEVKVGDATSGQELETFPIEKGISVTDAKFSPDRRYLAVPLWNTAVWLIDMETKQISELSGYGSSVKTVVFSPDSRTVFAGGWGGKIVAWDVATRKITKTLLGHTGDVVGLAVHPNGKLLASASWDHTIRVWTLDLPADPKPRVLTEHSGIVNEVTFSPDGSQLASAGEDGAVNVWETKSWKTTTTLRGHDGVVHHVSFSPGGKSVVSTGQDGQLKLWDLTRSQLGVVATGTGQLQRKVVFRADGTRFYVSSVSLPARDPDGYVTSHDSDTGKQLRVIGRRPGGFRTVAADPDGQFVAADSDIDIQLWDAATEKPLRELKGHASKVSAIAFLSGGILVSGADDGTVKLWRAATGELIHELEPRVGPVTQIAAEAQESVFAIAGNEGQLAVWRLTTGGLEEQQALRRDVGGPIASLACSSRDKTLAVGCANGHIRLWNLSSGTELPAIKGHTDAVVSLDFSPDGRRLASGGQEGAAVLWDTQSGQEALILRRQLRSLNGVAFSPDGQRLAAIASHAARDIRIWDSSARSTDDSSTRLKAWQLAEASGAESLRCWNVAIAHLDALIDSSAPDGDLWKRRGNCHAELCDWKAAMANYARTCELAPASIDHWYRRAAACLGANDLGEHRHVVAAMLKQFENTHAVGIASPMLYATTMCSQPPVERDEFQRLAQLAVNAFAGNQRLVGAVRYRLGDFTGALDSFDEAAPKFGPRAWDLCFRGMCRHKLGDSTAAAKHFQECDAWIEAAERQWKDRSNTSPRWIRWEERVEVLHLRREAESLLKQVPKP